MKNDLIKMAEQGNIEGRVLSDFQMKKIFAFYNKKIKVPKIKNKTQILLCPVGLVGAGKTTVIKPISEELNLLRISTDAIRKILKEKNFNFARTAEIALGLVIKFLNKGHSVALDADCVAPTVQKYIKKFQKEYKVVPVWIHIKPKEDFIIKKLNNFNHTWLFDDGEHAISDYKRRKPLHKKYLKSIKFYSKFDTSKDNINEQIKKFTAKVKKDFY
ncbi:hypothetical protein K8R32_01810 [bacterium]|nr:hypothetical protein [bacterium]